MDPDSLKERARLRSLTDEELMLEVQRGSNVSFDILVDRYKVRLLNYLFRLIGDRDEAEEIAQEAFVKAFIHSGKYKTIAKFSTWLYTIATNLVRNRIRAKSRAPQFLHLWDRGKDGSTESKPIDLVDPGKEPDEEINDLELSMIINQAIQRIPAKYRMSFVLREINQLSYEEIAAVTGLKLGTVRSRINRARNYFRKIVEPLLERGIDF
ncbi:MAG: sigma-70 family RNA polymerase sigma factor [Candidatus Latescibacteria bacterium]|nr:sigma-70 family RNA polymerase sigma factor [Candidatus Latescibacterota bacterium]NIM20969.1 sigma-70 family RNA polymerase sigma factor [Candidatus Latescibacterota bacterium]NIM65104.1 sigma-70 family RNA polymerase sigma factor [Candidatus Latescibacterota bacterium]NIO01619.1 sigma-70 family RNA polymerase sigma factor [Candidatus Latescibacterota bacterium]NIO28136.1 sigma-70 family RNA polymerase sigma factor [Candidatus Latescibacterota bacterium]